MSSRVKCCPGRCRSAGTFKERDREREREGKLDSVRLVSFCIQVWMYNDVHEYQYVYMCVCVVVRVSRLHVAGKNNEIASRERSSFKVS